MVSPYRTDVIPSINWTTTSTVLHRHYLGRLLQGWCHNVNSKCFLNLSGYLLLWFYITLTLVTSVTIFISSQSDDEKTEPRLEFVKDKEPTALYAKICNRWVSLITVSNNWYVFIFEWVIFYIITLLVGKPQLKLNQVSDEKRWLVDLIIWMLLTCFEFTWSE